MLTYSVKKNATEMKIINSIYPKIKDWDGLDDLQESYISLQQELNGYLGKVFEGIVYNQKTYGSLYELVAEINKPALIKFCLLRGFSHISIDESITKEYIYNIAEKEGVKCFDTFKKILPEVFTSTPNDYKSLASYKHKCHMINAYLIEVFKKMRENKDGIISILEFLEITDNYHIDLNGELMTFNPEEFNYIKHDIPNQFTFNHINIHITNKKQLKYPAIKHILKTRLSKITVDNHLLPLVNRIRSNKLIDYITIIPQEQYHEIFKKGYYNIAKKIFDTKYIFSLKNIEYMIPHFFTKNLPPLPTRFEILELEYKDKDTTGEIYERFYDVVEKSLPLYIDDGTYSHIDLINMFFNKHPDDKHSIRRAELSGKINAIYPATYKIFDYLSATFGYDNREPLIAAFFKGLIDNGGEQHLKNSQIIYYIKYIATTDNIIKSDVLFHVIMNNINLPMMIGVLSDNIGSIVKNLDKIEFPENFPNELKLKIVATALNN